ncbi:MAG: hypothetical protein Q8O84_01185 [Nanoarchaeota archaeon]|nr:hypothetical protein [Nanoarchaeota archaeon]
MTNKTLENKFLNKAKKIWNGAKKVALGASLIATPLIANAQVSTLTEKGSETATKVLQKDMLNAYDVPGYIIIDRTEDESGKEKTSIETVRVYPTFSTMRGNNELIPRLVYSPVKAQVEGQDVDVIKYRADEKDKKSIEELFAKKGEGGGVITLNATEAQAAGFHTIITDNGTFVYFPIDSANTLTNEEKEKIKKGKRIGVIFPADGMVIYEDIKPLDRTVEYLVGKPNQVFHLDLNENEIIDQKLHQEGIDALDSLGRKYLSSEKAERIYLDGNLIKGKAYDFKDFAFLNGKQEDSKEKNPSNLNGRIKVGAGVTFPNGFVGELNPQVQLGKKSFLGPYVSFSNSSKSLENITQEDGFREVVSVPAKMYFVSTGTEIKENTKTTNDLGVGLAFSYLASPNLEAFVKAGFIGQETKKTMTSSGEEYMEIDGVKDQSSVQSYNETNNSTERKMSGYVGAGVEYSPFAKKNNASKNLSVYGEFGHVFGENSMNTGSLGIKYTLSKSNKQDTQEQK